MVKGGEGNGVKGREKMGEVRKRGKKGEKEKRKEIDGKIKKKDREKINDE